MIQSPICEHRRVACTGCGGHRDGTCHHFAGGCDCERFYISWFKNDLTLDKFRGMLAENMNRVRMNGRSVPEGAYEAALEEAERLHAIATEETRQAQRIAEQNT